MSKEGRLNGEIQEINRIDIKEFRELGLLVELNRAFLHPLGLALEVDIDKDGNEKLGGIWDYRDDPEGMTYEKLNKEKVNNAQEFIKEKHNIREKELGFIYQEE